MHICGHVMMQKSVCRVSVHEERVRFCAHMRIRAIGHCILAFFLKMLTLKSEILTCQKYRNCEKKRKKKGHNSKCVHRKWLSVGTQAYFLQLPAFRCHCLLLLTQPTTSRISPHLYDRRGMVIIRNTFNSNFSAPPFESKSKNHTAAACSSLSALTPPRPPPPRPSAGGGSGPVGGPMCLRTSAANMAASLSLSLLSRSPGGMRHHRCARDDFKRQTDRREGRPM